MEAGYMWRGTLRSSMAVGLTLHLGVVGGGPLPCPLFDPGLVGEAGAGGCAN